MKLVSSLVALLLLAGCTKTVIKEVPIEVKVPVAAPCMGERPKEPTALRDKIPSETWESMPTDQRQNQLGAQAMARKAYGDKVTVASAGCP